MNEDNRIPLQERKKQLAQAITARHKRTLDRLYREFDRAYHALVRGHLDAVDQTKAGHRAAIARVERLP